MPMKVVAAALTGMRDVSSLFRLCTQCCTAHAVQADGAPDAASCTINALSGCAADGTHPQQLFQYCVEGKCRETLRISTNLMVPPKTTLRLKRQRT